VTYTADSHLPADKSLKGFDLGANQDAGDPALAAIADGLWRVFF
jgi:hypothetical protein